MKCPKCHYLSFDPEPRCRNCGFSLGLEAVDVEIADHPATETDLELHGAVDSFDRVDHDVAAATAAAVSLAAPVPRPSRRLGAVAVGHRPRLVDRAPGRSADPASAAPFPTGELPLFVKDRAEADVAPLQTSPIDVAEPDGASLSVPSWLEEDEVAAAGSGGIEPAIVGPDRAALPVAARPSTDSSSADDHDRQRPSSMWGTASATRRLGPLDRDLLDDLSRIDREAVEVAASAARAAGAGEAAGLGRRLGAALADVAFLGAVAGVLLAIISRATGVAVDELVSGSMWPAGAFVCLVMGSYLLVFTIALGQTPGKMLTGLRVVDAGDVGDRADPLRWGQACLRECIAVPSALVFGLGFLPALFGDRRAVHDRVAGTRVILE